MLVIYMYNLLPLLFEHDKYVVFLLPYQVLIAFGCGSCVLYDMKYNSSQAIKETKSDPHKRFIYDPGHSHVSLVIKEK